MNPLLLLCYAIIGISLIYTLLLSATTSDSKRRHRRMFGSVEYKAFCRNTGRLIQLADKPLFLRKTGRIMLFIGVVLLVLAVSRLPIKDPAAINREFFRLSPFLLLATAGLPLTVIGRLHVFQQGRPASLLYLAASNPAAFTRMQRLGNAAYPLRPVALLEEKTTTLMGENCFRVRKEAGTLWQAVVAEVCQFAGLILIDPGEFGLPVRWEAEHLVAHRLGYKTILIGFDSVSKSDETKDLMGKLLADGAWAVEDFEEVERFLHFLVNTIAVFPDKRTQHISSLYNIFKTQGDSVVPAIF